MADEPISLSDNAYGKSGIRLVRVLRDAARHELRDWRVAVRFQGDYRSAYLEGDNTHVLPTDTMKNTVYAFAKTQPIDQPEVFASALCRHFLGGNPEARSVAVDIVESQWRRLEVSGESHPHAFTPLPEKRHAHVAADRNTERTTGGLSDLVLLKSTASAFSSFRRDGYTTLPETRDRILATTVEATWAFAPGSQPDFGATWRAARQALESGFVGHFSESVQQTLWEMGRAVLSACPALESVHLRLPNLHHLPVDLGPFGLDGRGEVFVATDAPFGLIEGTIRRG